MKRLSISLLGGFEVYQDDKPLTGFRYDKVRALLALLSLEPGRSFRRDELAGFFWPDSSEETARTNLRQALANLRESLCDAEAKSPCLLVSRESIQWNASAEVDVDVLSFTRLLQACESHSHRRSIDCAPCARRRTEALQLYRGDLLQGFFLPDSASFDEWVTMRRESLRSQAAATFHSLAEYHERRGEYGLAEAVVRRELELEPWDEESHRQLMRLLYLSDKRSQALAQYELCRKMLCEELGVDPEAATTALYQQIRSEEPGTSITRASIALPAERPHNLPPTITPFFGREQELAQIAGAFDQCQARIISLVGPGGIGKTRLALQAATQQLDNFLDGVFFIPLEGLTNIEAAVFSIAHILGLNLAGKGEPLQRLVAQMAGKELLLVLDNYEHLLPETGLLVSMIQGAPKVTLLVTSRQRLNIRGEQVFDVGGLTLPSPSMSLSAAGDASEPAALALLASCAARIRADFNPQADDRACAAEICRMLDGIPLAIELAASWLSVLSCQELAQEIHRNVNILSGALQDLPERQRNLRAIFDRTWESLSPEETVLFRRLAVFHGGFDRQGAEEVACSSLPLLKSLLEKSLIRRNYRQGYEMHELARQYAFERLEAAGEVDATRRKHLDYYVCLMETLAPQLQTEAGPALLERLEDDHDNLRAALDWALASGSLLSGLRLANAMYRLWYWHDHAVEAQRRLEAVLASVYASPETFSTDLIAKANYQAGVFACFVLNWKLAQSRLEEALRLSRETGDRFAQSCALNSLGTVFFENADFEGARRMFEEALAIRKEIGLRKEAAVPLANLAEVARVQGDYAASQTYLEECLVIDQEAGNPGGMSIDLENLGWLRLVQGDLEGARCSCLRSLDLRERLGSREGIAKCLDLLALLAMSRPQGAETGARLYGAAEALRRSTGVPLPEESAMANYRPFLERGREALGEAAWEKAFQEGRLIEPEEAIRLAKKI